MYVCMYVCTTTGIRTSNSHPHPLILCFATHARLRYLGMLWKVEQKQML